MVDLIPAPEKVMEILRTTGAHREGHFVYPNGTHASHYFQMPLAFRFYDNARILAVALSRKLRMDKTISSRLPKVSIISPSPGGIPIAFAVREALSAEQIYWAEIENGERKFRQYIKGGDMHPCIIVDDLVRSGKAIEETVRLVEELGAEIIGIGTILRFEDAPASIGGFQIKSLAEFDCNFYNSEEEWKSAEGNNAESETVRY